MVSFFSLLLLVLVFGLHGGSGGVVGTIGAVGASTSMVIPPESGGICATSVSIYGYECHEFDVTTEDGYILNVVRIPQGRTEATTMDRQSVLIQHGVLVDGMTWMLNSPEQNLPMILADNGFDVWIANTRGTRFSRRHKSLDPSDPKFWNWSWDELVTYDLPAVFDFVYGRTGNKKINYVGHSLGTLIMLASLSEGRLDDKLKSVALLSPIAYLSHMTTPLGVVVAKSFVGEIVTSILGIAEFNPKGEPVGNFLKSLCIYPGVDCYDLLSSLTGKNCCLNSSTEELFIQNEPQSTSTRNMVHLAQTVRDGVLAKYDYGNPVSNLLYYGHISPPLYNLSNVAVDMPMFVSYGGRDALSSVHDVEHLLDHFKLHDVDKFSVQFIKDYAHADFIMGVNAKDIVYNAILSFFNHLQ